MLLFNIIFFFSKDMGESELYQSKVKICKATSELRFITGMRQADGISPIKYTLGYILFNISKEEALQTVIH